MGLKTKARKLGTLAPSGGDSRLCRDAIKELGKGLGLGSKKMNDRIRVLIAPYKGRALSRLYLLVMSPQYLPGHLIY